MSLSISDITIIFILKEPMNKKYCLWCVFFFLFDLFMRIHSLSEFPILFVSAWRKCYFLVRCWSRNYLCCMLVLENNGNTCAVFTPKHEESKLFKYRLKFIQIWQFQKVLINLQTNRHLLNNNKMKFWGHIKINTSVMLPYSFLIESRQ